MKNNIKFGNKNSRDNRRGFSADGSSLLPSALRPRLLNKRILVLPAVLLAMGFITNIFECRPTYAATLDLTIPDGGYNISQFRSTTDNALYGESSKTNITIKTNATWGYSLNIKARDASDNSLKGNNGGALTSIATALDNYETGGAINTWAFLPGKLNSTSNSKYQPGPKADLLLGKTSGANSEPEAYPLSIAAKVQKDQPSGSYKNTFVVSAVANSVSYKITYNLNSGSAGPTNPQTGTTADRTVKLDPNVPIRSSYTFKGWCDQYTTSDACSGTIYQSGYDFTLPLSGYDNVNLWAMWTYEGGCFIPDTMVDTPNGLTKIKDITQGSKVYAYDFEHNEIVEDEVEEVQHPTRDGVVKVSFEDDTYFEGTHTHLFYNKGIDDWTQLGEFQIGDILATVDGKEKTIKSIEDVEGEIGLYNLKTKQYHNYFLLPPGSTKREDRFIVRSAAKSSDLDPNNYDYLLERYTSLASATIISTTFLGPLHLV